MRYEGRPDIDLRVGCRSSRKRKHLVGHRQPSATSYYGYRHRRHDLKGRLQGYDPEGAIMHNLAGSVSRDRIVDEEPLIGSCQP
jgi:hypothetical protein